MRPSTIAWLPKSRLAVGSSMHQDRRFLGERAGDQRELALAAGDAGVVVLRELGDAEARRACRARCARPPVPGAGERLSRAVRPISTTSSTVKENSVDMRLRHIGEPRAISAGLQPASGTPSISTAPPSAGCRPSRVRNSVVLPAPFGPSRHSTSPGTSVARCRGRPRGRGSRSRDRRAVSRIAAHPQSSGRARAATGRTARRARR